VSRPGPSRLRKLIYAAVITLAVLALLEILGRLIVADRRYQPGVGDVAVELQSDPTVPVLEEMDDGTFTFARGTGVGSVMYRDQTWTTPAGPGDYRVIVVGDSTVHGPFPDALAAGLVVPGRTVELLNFGTNGAASDRARIVSREALTQDPDLLVVYVGHNEVMEARINPASLRPFWRRTVHSWVRHSGLGRLLSVPIRALTPAPPPPPAEPTWPAYLCGAVDDDDWATVGASYRRNLSRLAADAREAGVALAFVEPVSSLQRSDDPPVATAVIDPALAGVSEGLRACRDGRGEAALSRGDELAGQFPELGEPQLLRGHALLALGRTDEARESLRDARRREIHPTRASARHGDVLREVAAAEGAVFVPVDATFIADSRYLESGDPLFVDEMHPSPVGNILLAGAVVAGLAAILPEGSYFDEQRVDPSKLIGPGRRGFRPTH
jgi:lysophospholipase L1-like esterase